MLFAAFFAGYKIPPPSRQPPRTKTGPRGDRERPEGRAISGREGLPGRSHDIRTGGVGAGLPCSISYERQADRPGRHRNDDGVAPHRSRSTSSPSETGDVPRGRQPAVEPHSFDVKSGGRRGDKSYKWSYQSLEGRVEMAEESRRKAGVAIETAGPAKLALRLELNGKIAPNEEQYGGTCTPASREWRRKPEEKLGDKVRKARSSPWSRATRPPSLRHHGGDRRHHHHAARDSRRAGLGAGADFTIADLATVWADFSVYRQDFPLLREGQTVVLEGGPGLEKMEARIDYISPFGAEKSQTMLARADVPNPKGDWRPGLFVRGKVITDQVEVPVAVKANALQTFRDWDVVFIRVGELFEAVPVELGRRDDEWVEIKSGPQARRQIRSGKQLHRQGRHRESRCHARPLDKRVP